MRYVVLIMLLWLSFDISAMQLPMIEAATCNLKIDSQTAQNYKNLVSHKSWPRFYEFVHYVTKASESEQELDIKDLLKIIEEDDYDFLKSSQQEFHSLSKIENKEIFFMSCDAIINRCVASISREKFNMLLLNAVDEDIPFQAIAPIQENIDTSNDEVKKTNIPQAPPTKNRNRRDCVIS